MEISKGQSADLQSVAEEDGRLVPLGSEFAIDKFLLTKGGLLKVVNQVNRQVRVPV